VALPYEEVFVHCEKPILFTLSNVNKKIEAKPYFNSFNLIGFFIENISFFIDIILL